MLRENRSKRIVELEAQLEAIGAGGVEPLRRRECLHQISEPAGYTVPPGYRLQPLSELDAMCAAQSAREQRPDDDAVDALAKLMKAKLAKQRTRGYGGWDATTTTQQRLSDMLRAHVDKGDPVDVANFCAFLAARGEGIALAAPAAVAGPSNSEIDALVASIGPTEGMRRDSSDLTMDKLRVLVRRALATWGHIKAAPWEQNESAYQRGYMDGMAKGRRDVDAAPQQEAQEPVAWQGVHDQTDLYYTKPAQADVRPLYTTTQPAPAAQGDGHSTACLYQYALARLGIADSKEMRVIFWDAHEALKWDDKTDSYLPPVIDDDCAICGAARSQAKQGGV